MAIVETEYCVISDLISKLFSRRFFSKKNEIIKTGRPSPVIPNLTSVHKDKKREYIRHFITDDDNTIWLTGSSVLNKLYCWPCLLFSTENGVWSKVGFDNLNTLTVAICRHEKSINHINVFFK